MCLSKRVGVYLGYHFMIGGGKNSGTPTDPEDVVAAALIQSYSGTEA